MTERDKRTLGLLALLLLFLRRKERGGSIVPIDASDDAIPWTWPLPTIDWHGELLSAAESSAPHWRNPSRPTHQGPDLMYKRRPDTPAYVKGDHGTRNWWVPEGTPVYAAAAGKVWSVTKTARGVAVVIDHGKLDGVAATLYQHMLDDGALPAPVGTARGKLPSGQPAPSVAAGQRIGTVGWSDEDGDKVRHLHFEMWAGAGSKTAVDPATKKMSRWARRVWTPAPAETP